jgi:hypothetical protein
VVDSCEYCHNPSVSINRAAFSLFPERLLIPAEGMSSMGLFIAEGEFSGEMGTVSQ